MGNITGIFDSHAHYNDGRYDEVRDELLNSMKNHGVDYIINVGDDIKGSLQSVELAEKYSFIYAAVGIHPHNCEKTPADYLTTLKNFTKKEKVVLIGEIGLDYYYEHSPRELQKRFFEEQMQLAKELNLPVIIHSRDATEDTLTVLKNFPSLRGVVHCFNGSAQTAEIILSLGYYIGFTGVVTFPKARKVVEAVEVVPLDRLFVETDCPYLAPVPYRGKRCDSTMLPHTIAKIAEIKNESAQKIADVTRENVFNLFLS